MQVFKDRHGREWAVAITIATAKRIRERAGVNLFALVGERSSGLIRLLSDPVSFCSVLVVACDKAGVSDTFGDAMAGDSLEDAAVAFQAAFLEFFAQPGRKTEGSTERADYQKEDDGNRDDDAESLGRELERAVWRWAGILGVHPGPFTFGELAMMAEEALKERWTRTETLLAGWIGSKESRAANPMNRPRTPRNNTKHAHAGLVKDLFGPELETGPIGHRTRKMGV